MIGTNLNSRYEVQKLIGEGATSTVYLGVDGVLGRQVALKVLHPHVRDTTRKRFFQEAMAAAQLNHPNIMAIHDRGEDNGRDYLVVEYVNGQPLSDFVPTDTDTVIKLGSQIAYALHYAHEREIIHRDIKPANIMVTPEGNIKIMDLGLALLRGAIGTLFTTPIWTSDSSFVACIVWFLIGPDLDTVPAENNIDMSDAKLVGLCPVMSRNLL